MFNAEDWARTELHVCKLPGGVALCERVGKGISPWTELAEAMDYCTRFPAREFAELLAAGDFDVRWPLTFAAWYYGAVRR